MTGLLGELAAIHKEDRPFLIGRDAALRFSDIQAIDDGAFDVVEAGDVVALIGDFTRWSINALIQLIDRNAILVPLTGDTRPQHPYIFEAAGVTVVAENGAVTRLPKQAQPHPLVAGLKKQGHPGLVLFSSGTTGSAKGILHDFSQFLGRFRTPRPALRTLNFLLFDHIGGVNTLFHTLFNQGTVVMPTERMPEAVIADINAHEIELLPTTPTFLRILLMSGLLEATPMPSLKIITYGTERMDEVTLARLCDLLPEVDFRQTYGMSELGILRCKSKARDSLWMKVGGEGVETKIVDCVLKIRSVSRMLGYLNAPSPFDSEDWFDTKDIVEQDGDFIRIVGRNSDVISVAGVKVMPEEVERAALQHPSALYAAAKGVPNPITGEHIELTVQPREGVELDRAEMRRFLKERVPSHAQPHRIRIGTVPVNYRFKRG